MRFIIFLKKSSLDRWVFFDFLFLFSLLKFDFLKNEILLLKISNQRSDLI